MPTLVGLFFGLPGAGKSSLCARVVEALEADGVKTVVVALDEVYATMEGASEPWSAGTAGVWAAARRVCVEQVRAAVAAASSRHTAVLVDDNLHLRSMRKELFAVARDAGVAAVELLVDVPPEVAMGRNATRCASDRVPDAVMRRLVDGLERVSDDAPAWLKARSFEVDNRDDGLPAALRALGSGWDLVVPPVQDPAAVEAKAADRATTLASVSHGVDLCLRGCVRAAMKAGRAAGADMRALARKAHDARQAVLEATRRGEGDGTEGWVVAAFEHQLK